MDSESAQVLENDPRDLLARTRDATSKLLGPEWVEVEPGIFLPPNETQPAF